MDFGIIPAAIALQQSYPQACQYVRLIPLVAILFGIVFGLLFIFLLIKSKNAPNKRLLAFIFLALAVISFLMTFFGPLVLSTMMPSLIGVC